MTVMISGKNTTGSVDNHDGRMVMKFAATSLFAFALTVAGVCAPLFSITSAYSAPLTRLELYYNDARGDNFTVASEDGKEEAIAAGYDLIRLEGCVPPFAVGLLPLYLYYSGERRDNFITPPGKGEDDAQRLGYDFIRLEGGIFPSPQTGLVPLKLYYSDEREDNFSTATPQGEEAAQQAGYKFIRIQGYVYPQSQCP